MFLFSCSRFEDMKYNASRGITIERTPPPKNPLKEEQKVAKQARIELGYQPKDKVVNKSKANLNKMKEEQKKLEEEEQKGRTFGKIRENVLIRNHPYLSTYYFFILLNSNTDLLLLYDTIAITICYSSLLLRSPSRYPINA